MLIKIVANLRQGRN